MVGVIAGDTNRQVIAAITKEYALESAKVNFKDFTPTEVPQAFLSKQIQALLVVMPLSEKYITMLREIFPRNAKAPLGLVPIESAGAIEAVSPPYKSYELPKGTLRGSPPVPDDDLTTLRVPFYLVANKNLSDDVVAALCHQVLQALAGQADRANFAVVHLPRRHFLQLIFENFVDLLFDRRQLCFAFDLIDLSHQRVQPH